MKRRSKPKSKAGKSAAKPAARAKAKPAARAKAKPRTPKKSAAKIRAAVRKRLKVQAQALKAKLRARARSERERQRAKAKAAPRPQAKPAAKPAAKPQMTKPAPSPPPPVKGRYPPPPVRGFKTAPSPPPPASALVRPQQQPMKGGMMQRRPGQPGMPGKPPRPTMPWPTGTSTAGLRVATKDGILPPKPPQTAPPPPKRRIVDTKSLGKIARVDVADRGVRVTMEDGRKLLYPFGLLGPEDILRVSIAFDGEGIVLALRNGQNLDVSLMRIRAMSESLDEKERKEGGAP